MRINGKLALVTGGSTGIGQEIARQLAAKGAKVIIVARDRDRAASTIAHFPDRISLLQADLSLHDEQGRIVAEVTQNWQDLAILVNNAGIQVNMVSAGIGHEERMADLREEIAINLTAPITLSFGLMPLLARQKDAAIVNISSGLAIAPKRTAPVYCATKAGLRIFTRALRYRCEDAAPTIRVIDVVMAFVDTGMTRSRSGSKISATDAAAGVIGGLERNRDEVWIGKTKLLRAINRLSPAVAQRLLRNG
jgi:uncharacterized oxidoreductase